VARIHRCGEQQDFQHRKVQTRARLGDESRDYLLDESFIPADLADAYATVCEQALEFVGACFDRCGPHATLRIHGDFHPGNVLVRDGTRNVKPPVDGPTLARPR
jgi:Ser/Thr protein kinase RdoA (MazF antagonist)